jgi:OFA family oxalate/formate antiporter-like MFS transporter
MENARRWSYLVLAAVTMIFLGTIYAWSIFRSPLSQMFASWTATQISLTFTIFTMIVDALMGTRSNKLRERCSSNDDGHKKPHTVRIFTEDVLI